VRSALASLAVLALAACTRPTQLVVIVDSDDLTPGTADLYEVVVTSFAPDGSTVDTRTYPIQDAADLPLSFALVPRGGDASRPIDLRVEGHRNGMRPTIVRRVRTMFASGEARTLRIELSGACGLVVCSGSETCDRGTCLPIDVPVRDLPPFEPGSDRRDAFVPPADAGPDVPCRRDLVERVELVPDLSGGVPAVAFDGDSLGILTADATGVRLTVMDPDTGARELDGAIVATGDHVDPALVARSSGWLAAYRDRSTTRVGYRFVDALGTPVGGGDLPEASSYPAAVAVASDVAAVAVTSSADGLAYLREVNAGAPGPPTAIDGAASIGAPYAVGIAGTRSVAAAMSRGSAVALGLFDAAAAFGPFTVRSPFYSIITTSSVATMDVAATSDDVGVALRTIDERAEVHPFVVGTPSTTTVPLDPGGLRVASHVAIVPVAPRTFAVALRAGDGFGFQIWLGTVSASGGDIAHIDDCNLAFPGGPWLFVRPDGRLLIVLVDGGGVPRLQGVTLCPPGT
jgi:hypothetical protein